MSESFDLILKNGFVVSHNGTGQIDVGVKDGKIAALDNLDDATADDVIDCMGLHILPGVIDSQVHFREPGLEHKEDLLTGSRAAVMGGVTSVFEMPNTNPTTTTQEAFEDKIARATNRMFCDFAFFIGGSRENADELPRLEKLPGCCGVKVFMGSSTGDLLVDDDGGVRDILSKISRRAAFHSEDEYRLKEREGERIPGDPSSHPVWRDEIVALRCTERLVKIARETGARIHILHISTGDEVPVLIENKDIATMEVTPHHLTLEADAYEKLGTKVQMNPPVRGGKHLDALWQALRDGVVDVLGSDHAPHTREEKAKPYPASPSGMTGVQTLVPIMLDHVHHGKLSLLRFVDLTSHGPQRIFQIAGKGRIAKGWDADFTIVDLKEKRTITDDWIESKAGWTPYHGKTVTGWPKGTIIRGRRVMWEDEILDEARGQAVRFMEIVQ